MKTFEFKELSRAERATLDFFLEHLDGEVSFAVIGEGTVILIAEDDPAAGEDAVRAAIGESVDRVLSVHPDFDAVITQDGYGIVVVGRLAIATSGKLSEREIRAGEMDFATALTMRGTALDFAESAEENALIAAAFPD